MRYTSGCMHRCKVAAPGPALTADTGRSGTFVAAWVLPVLAVLCFSPKIKGFKWKSVIVVK
jgi:hypothetical protein